MALIICPECGKEISDKAQSCIHCGYPVSQDIPFLSKNNTEISKTSQIKNELKVLFKKIGIKKLVAVIIVLISIISAIAVISGIPGKSQKSIKPEKIEINKIYEIDGIGELEILRVSTTKHVVSDNMAHVTFECYFKNTTNQTYSLTDLVTISAKSKETGAFYNNFQVLYPYKLVVNGISVEPYVREKVNLSIETPDEGNELIIDISFGRQTFSFEYIVGDVVRNTKSVSIKDTVTVDDVARIKINNIGYSNGIWAPNAYSGRTHSGYTPNDEKETVFLIIDTMYTNLMSVNQAPQDVGTGPVKINAVFENEYHYTTQRYYRFTNNSRTVSLLNNDAYIPNAEVRTIMIVEVPRIMIEKSADISIFIGDCEFSYTGIPEYINNYGMNLYY